MNTQKGYVVYTSDSFEELNGKIAMLQKASWKAIGGPVVWNDENGKKQFSQAIVLN
tara:strand:- start:110 stop:277 length:168 start_codon:yes stop_codon:yes gene_type:complete